MPNTILTERGREGVEDIVDSGHYEEFNSMSALPMFIQSLTSTVFCLYCGSTPGFLGVPFEFQLHQEKGNFLSTSFRSFFSFQKLRKEIEKLMICSFHVPFGA